MNVDTLMGMSDDFDIKSEKIEFECEVCKCKFDVTVGQFAEGAAIKCPGCGEPYNLTDVDDGAKKAVQKVDELNKLIDNFFK